MLRHRRARPLLVFICAAIALLMLPAAANADTVTNSVGANATVRIPAGTSIAVSYRLLQRNKDGQKGCNASPSKPAILTITAPGSVSVTPVSRQLSFKNCKQSQSATFSAASQGGPYTISVTMASSDPSATGTYSTDLATFTLIVLPPPDVDAPRVMVHFPAPNGSNGWHVSKPVIGTVTATDPSTVTAIECLGATLTNLAGLNSTVASADLVVEAEGPTYVTCQATDGSTPVPHSGIQPGSVYGADVLIDTAPPAVTRDLGRDPDSNGWYNHSLTVSFMGEDDSSGVDVCDDPVTYAGPDQANVMVWGTCSDLAGNHASQEAASFQYDATPPTQVMGTPDRPAGFHGGYRDTVTITFGGTDAVSGAAPGSLTCSSVTYNGPASPLVTVSGTCTDPAGNTSVAANYSFKFYASLLLPHISR